MRNNDSKNPENPENPENLENPENPENPETQNYNDIWLFSELWMPLVLHIDIFDKKYISKLTYLWEITISDLQIFGIFGIFFRIDAEPKKSMLTKKFRFLLADINTKELPSNDSNIKNVFLLHFSHSENVKIFLVISRSKFSKVVQKHFWLIQKQLQ